MLIGNPSNFNIGNVAVITLFNYSNSTVRQALLLSHCTDEGTEAPRDYFICSVLHYYVGGCTLGLKSGSIWSQSFGLTFLVYSLFVLSLLWYVWWRLFSEIGRHFLVSEVSWSRTLVLMKQLFTTFTITTLSKAVFVVAEWRGHFTRDSGDKMIQLPLHLPVFKTLNSVVWGFYLKTRLQALGSAWAHSSRHLV